MPISDYQKQIDDWAQTLQTPYWAPLSMLARVTEEVGELAKALNHVYGDKIKKPTDGADNIADEIADIMFALMCIANSEGIDLDEAMQKTINKSHTRDKDRLCKEGRLMAAPEGLSNAKSNWLRAAVLGANDGVVSVSSIILGVAGATQSRGAIFTAGMAGLVAGALSMAVGEYVSVSSQSDTEKAYIAAEKQRLATDPAHEFDDLVQTYKAKGLSTKTAQAVVRELTEHDPIKAHLEAEFGIDEADLNSPTQAALASMVSFTVGGLVPLLAMLSAHDHTLRVEVTFVAVLIALCLTGYLSATVGGASRRRAILRVVIGGALAMIITYAIGHAFGTVVQ